MSATKSMLKNGECGKAIKKGFGIRVYILPLLRRASLVICKLFSIDTSENSLYDIKLLRCLDIAAV
jgi:hypothetical protein